MFQGASFPIGSFVMTLLWLAAIGVIAMLGGAIWLVVWLIQHVRFA